VVFTLGGKTTTGTVVALISPAWLRSIVTATRADIAAEAGVASEWVLSKSHQPQRAKAQTCQILGTISY